MSAKPAPFISRVASLWQGAGDAVLLVMDDRAGRIEATALKIPLIGTAGMIGLAKVRGLIPTARPSLERLAQAGYFLGKAVTAEVLADVGE
jgi:predicted nucleic acid-binding protein